MIVWFFFYEFYVYNTHISSTYGIKLQPKLQLSSVQKIKGMNWRFMLEQIYIKQVWEFQN